MPELTPQQKEALNYKKHISLTANAGSGKTFVLSKRFVEIFLNEEIDLGGIVAITFTDKAAGELNRKIAGEVDERLTTETDPQKRKRLKSLRRQLVSSNISTIHSFCINILREFAPEAGIDANFSPIDQTVSDELIDLCVEETLNGLILDNDRSEKLKYVIRFFGSKKTLANQLRYSIYRRKEIDFLEKTLYALDAKDLAVRFREIFEKNFCEIFDGNITAALADIKTVNDFAFEQKSGRESAAEISGLLSKLEKQLPSLEKVAILSSIKELMLTQKGEVRSRGYISANRDEVEVAIEKVESFFNSIDVFWGINEPEKSELELAHFGKTFLSIYDYANSLYSQKKKQKSYLDFEDILLYAQKALRLEDVKNYLVGKYKFIMIDEYQDTNELQYEIFMPILDYLKSGNLFIVGDEKQSIYMFRNADLEIFERTKNEIKSLNTNGELLSLPHSFRMSPKLVLFTNYIFSNLFKNADTHFNEVGPNNLICAKDENEKGTVEILLAEQDGQVTEAELTAAEIAQLISGEDNDIELKDIAVLCRKRESFRELENIFVEKGIPYSIIGGKGFYQRQTIYDIYNYLSFLLNNENDAALAGVLRSPFFHLSDLGLLEISGGHGKTFFEKLESKSGSHEKYKAAFEKLRENIKIASSSEIYRLIRKILLESGYWSVIAAKRNAAQELANIEKLLMLARNFSRKSFKNLYDFTVSLRESIEGYEDEGQAQVAGDMNTVKLMTIHQAKGLEFKAVFLFGCNDKAYEEAVRTRSLSIDKNFGLLSKVPVDGNYFLKYSPAPVTLLYNYSIRRKNLAEVKRLLYVAVTRAVSRLYITATTKKKEPKRESFLDLIGNGLHTDFLNQEISISSDVEFMKYDDNGYSFYKHPLTLKVPIVETAAPQPVKVELIAKPELPKEIFTLIIGDVPKQEIISATKISMFSQCPVKYQLTYQIGFSTIYKLLRERTNDYEFNDNEDDELKPFAQLRGRLIHLVLKNEVPDIELAQFISAKLAAENIEGDGLIRVKLVESISDEIKHFYNSAMFRYLQSASNYKNEIEIYCEEEGHYLYGIIDKLIIEKDKLVIVDYKTDNIQSEQLVQRATDYLPQLKFYAYILSKLYSQYSRFELELIFLKFSDQPYSVEISRDELKNFELYIDQAIKKIYSQNFVPDLSHCPKCHFALKGNQCVVPL